MIIFCSILFSGLYNFSFLSLSSYSVSYPPIPISFKLSFFVYARLFYIFFLQSVEIRATCNIPFVVTSWLYTVELLPPWVDRRIHAHWRPAVASPANRSNLQNTWSSVRYWPCFQVASLSMLLDKYSFCQCCLYSNLKQE